MDSGKFLFVSQELWGYKLSAWSNYSCVYRGNPTGSCESTAAWYLPPFPPGWCAEQLLSLASLKKITAQGLILFSPSTASDKQHRSIYDLLSNEL